MLFIEISYFPFGFPALDFFGKSGGMPWTSTAARTAKSL
jgi:hypothetical protein